jgi:Na+/melibiose symporter-like transporter
MSGQAQLIREPWWRLAAFASPSAPLLGLSLPGLIFLGPYFNEHLGLTLSTVSAIFLVARIGDIVIDPMIGSWQDRTQHPFGRRRIWLVAATPVMLVVLGIVYLGFKPGASPYLVAPAVFAMYAVYAALMIAHLSWAGELQPDYHGRTQTLGAVQIAGMIGYVGMLLVPAVVMGAGGMSADAVHAMGWAGIIGLPLTVWACVTLTPERITPPAPHAGFKEAIAALQQSMPLRRVLIPDLLIGVTYGVSGALFVFLFRYYLGYEREAELLLLIYFVSGLCGIPIWTWAGRKFGKHRAFQVGCLYSAIALMSLPFFPKNDLPVAIAGMIVAGLGQSSGTMLVRAMMADVVDDEEARTGANRSGLFFGLLLTTSKVGVAVGPLTYVVLDLFGFDAKLGAVNSPEAMAALAWMFALVPCALNIASALSVINYPLDEKRQEELRAAIEARRTSA